LFLGLVSAGLIYDSFRSFLRQRERLIKVAGKKPQTDEDVVKPPDAQSWITIRIMWFVIVVCIFAFCWFNPLRLKA
jgi:Na+/melibiose symporter-like transporter